MHHSKSLSFLYEKATGRAVDAEQLANLYKFACLIRTEVLKDCKPAATLDQAKAEPLTKAECDAALRWLDVTRLYAFVEPEDEALADKLNHIRALAKG